MAVDGVPSTRADSVLYVFEQKGMVAVFPTVRCSEERDAFCGAPGAGTEVSAIHPPIGAAFVPELNHRWKTCSIHTAKN